MTLPADAAQPSAEWFEIKGRLFRFFGTHAGWAKWHDPSSGAWICGQERDRDHEVVRATRVAAVVHDPRLIPSRSMPEQHAFADVTAAGWNRLLLGIFTYLGGPARLDDVVTIAAVMLRLAGAAAMATGSAVAPEGDHLSYEDMDAAVENTLDAAAQDRIAVHNGACEFCARQFAAYQAAAVQVSAPIHRIPVSA
jgi:hypothetical protein